MTPTELGPILRNARETKGLTQSDVARACGVTQAAVQKWESGVSTPRGGVKIKQLADTLGIDPAAIHMAHAHAQVLTAPDPRPLLVASHIRPRLEGPDLLQKIREEHAAAFAACLPPELHRHLQQSLDIKGVKYEFQYMSKKVLATLLHLPIYAGRPPTTPIRLAIYKHAIASRHYNDGHIPDHHYLIGLIAADGQPIDIPRACANEARLFDVHLEALTGVEDLCRRVVELEQTPTDAEVVYTDMMEPVSWEDILDDHT